MLLALTALYVAAGKLGLRALGAFLVNVTTAGSVATSIGIAAGNTLEGLLGAWLANRFARGRYAFERTRDIFAFTVAVVPGAVVSATMGVASLVAAGYAQWTAVGPIWLIWSLGNVTGALIVAPPALLGADRRSSLLLRRPLEAACLLLSVIAAGYAVFGGLSPLGPRHRWPSSVCPRSCGPLFSSAVARPRPPCFSCPASPCGERSAIGVVMTQSVAAVVWARDRDSTWLQTIIDRIPVMISVYEANTRSCGSTASLSS